MDADGHDLTSELTARRLLDALNADQFVLYCQPIARVNATAPRMRYIEILVRFKEEEQLLLPPGSFFPVLEEAGLMPMLDRWVIRQTLRWLKRRRTEAPNQPLPRCGVNLNAAALRDRHLAGYVKQELLASGVSPDYLFFEFSLDDIRGARQHFLDLAGQLKPLNCGMAVAGFGVGATSLPGLQRLGVRIVKVDGGLVRMLGRRPVAQERLATIVQACSGLGMHSVAEMVEEPATINLLRQSGVDYAQGFAVGMPVPLAQLG